MHEHSKLQVVLPNKCCDATEAGRGQRRNQNAPCCVRLRICFAWQQSPQGVGEHAAVLVTVAWRQQATADPPHLLPSATWCQTSISNSRKRLSSQSPVNHRELLMCQRMVETWAGLAKAPAAASRPSHSNEITTRRSSSVQNLCNSFNCMCF